VNNQKLKWLLIASLTLNLFLIGGIAGGAYRLLWSDHAALAERPIQRGLRFAADDLSIEQRMAFRKTLRETRREAKPLIEAAREKRAEVRKLLAASAFDRQAVTSAINQTREADIALRMRIENALVSFAETLSQQERIKLAEGLAKRGPLRQQTEAQSAPDSN